jgi:hypothetical protein
MRVYPDQAGQFVADEGHCTRINPVNFVLKKLG